MTNPSQPPALSPSSSSSILQGVQDYLQHKADCRKGKPTLGCPRCGCQLKRVTRGPNSMLNEYQFDAVKAGDYYCDGCPGTEATGTSYKYWWTRELGTAACSCGLDTLVASLTGPQEPQNEQEDSRVDTRTDSPLPVTTAASAAPDSTAGAGERLKRFNDSLPTDDTGNRICPRCAPNLMKIAFGWTCLDCGGEWKDLPPVESSPVGEVQHQPNCESRVCRRCKGWVAIHASGTCVFEPYPCNCNARRPPADPSPVGEVQGLTIKLRQLLCDVAQILDGWKQTDPANWTTWDESVRQRISVAQMQEALYGPHDWTLIDAALSADPSQPSKTGQEQNR